LQKFIIHPFYTPQSQTSLRSREHARGCRTIRSFMQFQIILFALFAELNHEPAESTSPGSECCSQTYMGNNGRSKLDPLSASGNVLCTLQD